eukprot:383461-Rhodomonas_salina.3
MCFSYVGLAVVGTAPDMEVLCFGVCGGCGQRADRERKMLMGQVSELKNEVARKVQTLSFAVQRMSHTHGCSNQLLSGGLRVGCIVSGDVTSKLSDLKTTVTNIKDGAPTSERGLWSFESDDDAGGFGAGGAERGGAAGSAASESASAGGRVEGVGESAARHRIRALEQRVAAQHEVRERERRRGEEEKRVRTEHCAAGS